MTKQHFFLLGSIAFLLIFSSCKKDEITTDALYVPTASDATATATHEELQQGRTLYINNCGACHNLYSPDSYTPTNWQNILSSMVPRTSLSTADADLVYKYVSRGK